MLRADRALMRQVQANVDAGFSDLLFEIRCLLEDLLNQWRQLLANLLRPQVPKVQRHRCLDQVEESDVVFEDWIFESFLKKLEQGLEADLRWQVVSVDLSEHRVSPVRVEIVKLLLDFLDRCESRRPRLAVEARDEFFSEEGDQRNCLRFLGVGQRFTVREHDRGPGRFLLLKQGNVSDLRKGILRLLS